MYKRAISLSKFPTPQLELNMSPVFTNDPQMTRLFNYLIISRIIKITLSRKLRLILCCYIYILSSCPMSFLNLFLPMVIQSRRWWLFQCSRVITRWPQRVPHTPQPLVTPGCGVNNGHQLHWHWSPATSILQANIGRFVRNEKLYRARSKVEMMTQIWMWPMKIVIKIFQNVFVYLRIISALITWLTTEVISVMAVIQASNWSVSPRAVLW